QGPGASIFIAVGEIRTAQRRAGRAALQLLAVAAGAGVGIDLLAALGLRRRVDAVKDRRGRLRLHCVQRCRIPGPDEGDAENEKCRSCFRHIPILLRTSRLSVCAFSVATASGSLLKYAYACRPAF